LLRSDIVSRAFVYGTGIGQVLAQVTGQVFMHYHRAVVAAARSRAVVLERGATETDNENIYGQSDSSRSDAVAKRPPDTILEFIRVTSEVPSASLPTDERRVLHRDVFLRPHRDNVEQLRVRSWVSPAIVVSSVLAIGLLLAGCIVPSFSFEISGMIANAIQEGQEHSVISVAQLLVSEARFLGDSKYLVGLGLLSALLIVMVVAVPILHVCALLVQWFCPLPRDSMKKMHHVSELLHAWQYTEVYLLSSVACAIQLSGVSDFLGERYCEGLQDALSLMANGGFLQLEGETCYAITGSVEYGSILLLIAVILIGTLRLFVAEAADQSLAGEAVAMAYGINRSAGEDVAEHGKAAVIKRIDCPPVLFAHRFRWFLRPVSQ
jgi:hypothetical protein